MADLVSFPLEGGGNILVEVETPQDGVVRRGMGATDLVHQAEESLDRVVSRVTPAVQGLITQLRSQVGGPDEVEVEFGIKLNVEAGVIIARTAGEANFRLAMKWTRRTDA